MERTELERLSREELIGRAEAAGVVRPRTLTIPELIDELVRASSRKGASKTRGWFGRARDLLTSVIDLGRTETGPRRTDRRAAPPAPPPLPTVTLAEIYAAQGHLERAITTLDEVLAREADHPEAKALKGRFEQQLYKTKPSSPPPVVEAVLSPMEERPSTSTAESSGTGTGTGTGEIGKSAEARPATVPPLRRPVAPVVVEVDEIVGLAVDPHTVYLYWEIRPATLASARAVEPNGALIVRAVTVRPSLEGPVTDVRDFRVDALFGELFIHGLPAQANVRISIGYKTNAGFEPFAVAMDLSTPREVPAPEVARTFRKWSEAGRPSSAERPPPAQHTGSMPDYGAEGSESLLSKFPAGVWVDPATRVVRVVGTNAPARQGSDVISHTFVMRPDGSSELVRRVVWASDQSVWASNVWASNAGSWASTSR